MLYALISPFFSQTPFSFTYLFIVRSLVFRSFHYNLQSNRMFKCKHYLLQVRNFFHAICINVKIAYPLMRQMHAHIPNSWIPVHQNCTYAIMCRANRISAKYVLRESTRKLCAQCAWLIFIDSIYFVIFHMIFLRIDGFHRKKTTWKIYVVTAARLKGRGTKAITFLRNRVGFEPCNILNWTFEKCGIEICWLCERYIPTNQFENVIELDTETTGERGQKSSMKRIVNDKKAEILYFLLKNRDFEFFF